MSEVLTADQALRIKAMELCIALYAATPDTDIEAFESMANDVYEFIKGEAE